MLFPAEHISKVLAGEAQRLRAGQDELARIVPPASRWISR
jgi:hypothetical protein